MQSSYSLSLSNDVSQKVHGFIEAPLGLEPVSHQLDMSQLTTVRLSKGFKGPCYAAPGGVEFASNVLPGTAFFLLGSLEVGQTGVPEDRVIVDHLDELQLVGGVAPYHC